MNKMELNILILKLINNDEFDGFYDNLKEHTKEEIDSKTYHNAISMLVDENLLTGFIPTPVLGEAYTPYIPNNPRLTIRGLEYLESKK